MDRYRTSRLRPGLNALFRVGLGLALVAGLTMTGATFVAGPASAEVECTPPAVPTPGPDGEIRCTGGNGDPDPDPEPEPREPAEGTVERHPMYETCTPDNPNPSPGNPGCGGNIGTCQAPEVPTNVYSRNEIYYRATGWQPVKDEGTAAGDWWMYDRTECRAPAAPTAAEVWAAVKRFRFQGAKAQIEPVNGRTLVNLPTNFYTTAAPIGPVNLQVGGATVQIWATPEKYVWNFGDGSNPLTTTTPGAKYPNMLVKHVYKKADQVAPSVTVWYHVEWAFNGNRQPFPEPLPAATSPTTPLQVLEIQGSLSGR